MKEKKTKYKRGFLDPAFDTRAHPRTPVLNKAEMLRVIQWAVELKSTRAIAKLIEENFGKKINHSSVWNVLHSRKWQPLISRLRREFDANINKIPIANKSIRLLYLQRIADEAFMPTLKSISAHGDKIYMTRLGDAAAAIREAREEVTARPLVGAAAVVHDSRQINISIEVLKDKSDPELVDIFRNVVSPVCTR